MLWPTIKQQQKICQFLKLATATAVSSNSSTMPIKQTKANSFSVSFCWHGRTKIWNKLKLRTWTNYHDNTSDKYSMNEMMGLYWVEQLKVMFHTMQCAANYSSYWSVCVYRYLYLISLCTSIYTDPLGTSMHIAHTKIPVPNI